MSSPISHSPVRVPTVRRVTNRVLQPQRGSTSVGHAGDQLYYHERAHIKAFIKRLAPYMAALLLAVVIMIGGAVYLSGRINLSIQFVGVLLTIGIVLATVREYWRLQNWTREFDGVKNIGVIHRPGNRLLFIPEYTDVTIQLSESVIGDPSSQNRLEQYLFRRSSTLTIDSEAQGDVLFHNMHDFKDADRVRDIIKWCSAQEQRRNQEQAESLGRLLSLTHDVLEEQRRTNRLLNEQIELQCLIAGVERPSSQAQTPDVVNDDTAEMEPIRYIQPSSM